jgi:hypothetical protein
MYMDTKNYQDYDGPIVGTPVSQLDINQSQSANYINENEKLKEQQIEYEQHIKQQLQQQLQQPSQQQMQQSQQSQQSQQIAPQMHQQLQQQQQLQYMQNQQLQQQLEHDKQKIKMLQQYNEILEQKNKVHNKDNIKNLATDINNNIDNINEKYIEEFEENTEDDINPKQKSKLLNVNLYKYLQDAFIILIIYVILSQPLVNNAIGSYIVQINPNPITKQVSFCGILIYGSILSISFLIIKMILFKKNNI